MNDDVQLIPPFSFSPRPHPMKRFHPFVGCISGSVNSIYNAPSPDVSKVILDLLRQAGHHRRSYVYESW